MFCEKCNETIKATLDLAKGMTEQSKEFLALAERWKRIAMAMGQATFQVHQADDDTWKFWMASQQGPKLSKGFPTQEAALLAWDEWNQGLKKEGEG